MVMDSHETNPCDSPLASGVSSEPRRRRFPWRIVPVVLLYLYGGLAVLDSVVYVFMVLGGCCVFIGNTHLASNAQISCIMLGMVLFGIHGCFAIAVGRYLWKQLWRRSVAAAAGAIVLVLIMCATSWVVHRLPPGMQWPPPTGTATDN
jgi:hypothetical protein